MLFCAAFTVINWEGCDTHIREFVAGMSDGYTGTIGNRGSHTCLCVSLGLGFYVLLGHYFSHICLAFRMATIHGC